MNRSIRTLSLVGVIKNRKVVAIARRCGWCRRFNSTEDIRLAHECGAKISDGICPPCERKFLAQLDAMPTPPSAA